MIQNHKKWSAVVQKVWILLCSNLNPLWGRLEAHLEAVSIIHDFPSYRPKTFCSNFSGHGFWHTKKLLYRIAGLWVVHPINYILKIKRNIIKSRFSIYLLTFVFFYRKVSRYLKTGSWNCGFNKSRYQIWTFGRQCAKS